MRLLSMGTAGLIEEVAVPGSPQRRCYMALTCLKLPTSYLQGSSRIPEEAFSTMTFKSINKEENYAQDKSNYFVIFGDGNFFF